MFRLKLVPDNSAFDFLRQLKVTASISVLLVLASITLFFVSGLNLGIDFRGGILLKPALKRRWILQMCVPTLTVWP